MKPKSKYNDAADSRVLARAELARVKVTWGARICFNCQSDDLHIVVAVGFYK